MLLLLFGYAVASRVAKSESFQPLSYQDITDTIRDIHETYPDCMRVYDALEEYPELLSGLAASPTCIDDVACEFLVVEFGDVANTAIPQVFMSGALHGDERPGPVALVETIRMICEGVTGMTFSDKSVIMIPTTNPWGYSHSERMDNGVDPNRDFPYDTDPSLTLQSMTAKVVNRVFSAAGNIQSGITFHAGISSITYPWGSPNHMGDVASDNTAMDQMALELRNISGKKDDGTWNYEYGDMNHVVYPVTGGMEDWAYSLGFEKSPYCSDISRNIALTPICTNVLPSASIFLVEASDDKSLSDTGLGNPDDVWDATEYVPLIPRLIRMTLRTIDLVQPRARVMPMTINGSIALEVDGCQELSSIDIQCDETQKQYSLLSSPVQCVAGLLLFSKQDFVECNDATLYITFDSHWKSDGGQLQYTKDRTSVLRETPNALEDGRCAMFENNLYACITPNHLYIHPGLIRYKPAVYVGDILIAVNITNTLSKINLSSDEIQDVVIIQSYDQSVSFTSDRTGPSQTFVWILFVLDSTHRLLILARLRRDYNVF